MAIAPLVVPQLAVKPPTVASLLNNVGRIGGVDAVDRWMNGITWEPRPSRNMSVGAVDTCSPADPTDPNYGCVAAITQDAFQVYDTFHASLLEYTPDMVDAVLLDRFRIMASSVFARELVDAAGSGGLSLANQAHAPALRAFGTAALTLAQGIAVLEDDLARTLDGGEGIIHLGPGLLGQATELAGVEYMDGKFYTKMGHLVVADAGYVDMKEPAGQAASGAMKEWIYASGPVAVASTEPDLIGVAVNEYTDLTRNTIVRWLSAYGVIQFDPAPVTAVLVDY